LPPSSTSACHEWKNPSAITPKPDENEITEIHSSNEEQRNLKMLELEGRRCMKPDAGKSRGEENLPHCLDAGQPTGSDNEHISKKSSTFHT
jgi:hypothetical protein